MDDRGTTADSTIRTINDGESDYGSDFDELDFAAVDPIVSHPRLESIDDIDPLPHVLHIRKRVPSIDFSTRRRPRLSNETLDSRSDDPSRGPASSVQHIEHCDQVIRESNPRIADRGCLENVVEPDDKRSPLERFRTAPKRPLSVTDLASPAWCELKYWYSLTKYGKVRRTPAMRQGSKVHKDLEDQVHETVPVETKTREDAFALRICNVIQGLRTLRTSGLTREFQVWGVIDGQVINGVIDVLTTKAPDEALVAEHYKNTNTVPDRANTLPSNQPSLRQYFRGADPTIAASPILPTAPDQVYLADVKTRQNRTVPRGSSLRPVHMQLQLYHKLLSDLAAGKVDKNIIFQRFGLKADATFSDAFIAEMGRVDLPDEPHDNGLLDELLEFNTLSKMWEHMIDEFRAIIPVTTQHSSISSILRVEFRSAENGRVMGSVLLSYMEPSFNEYIASEMAWWRGERPAVGVEIEDAPKCHTCEFAELCTWRQAKAEEFRARMNQRRGIPLAHGQKGSARSRSIDLISEGDHGMWPLTSLCSSLRPFTTSKPIHTTRRRHVMDMQRADRSPRRSVPSVPVRAPTQLSTSSTGSPPPLVSRFKLKLRTTDGKTEPAAEADSATRAVAEGPAVAATIASRQPGGEHWSYLRDWEAISRLVRRVDWVFDAGPGTKRRDCLIETQCFMNRIAIYPDKRYKFVRMLGDILLGGIEGPRGLGTTTKMEFEDAVIRCLVELRIIIDVSDMDFFTRVRALKDIYARWALEDVMARALAPHVQEQRQHWQ